MKPDLADITQVSFRHFGKNAAGVPQVKMWDRKTIPRGQAWDRIDHHLKGNGQMGHPPDQQHTEMSIQLDNGKSAYLISFDLDKTHTVFGPGSSPITLLPPGLSDGFLTNVGLVYPGASGAPDFLAARDIPTKYTELPAAAALLFTCDRDALVQMWNEAFKEHGHTVTFAMPFFLNLYDTVSKLPVWASDAHRAEKHGEEVVQNVETHGGIHPTDEPPPGFIATHGGIHPTSNVQMLY